MCLPQGVATRLLDVQIGGTTPTTHARPDLVLQAIETARGEGRIDKATAERQRLALRGEA